MRFSCRLRVVFSGLALCALTAHASAIAAVPALPQAASSSTASSSVMVTIPGPLRSFLRMAAISQKVSPEEVLPLLARNVFVNGHRRGEATEYLTLLQAYVVQAREIAKLTDSDGVLRVANCKDAEPLLAVLGYRLKDGCGPEAIVESAQTDKAFLTVDSGFPLADLEETLRSDKPFAYPYVVKVPALFRPEDWTAAEGRGGKAPPTDDLIDSLLRDPALGRLYWALSRMDAETREALRRSPGLAALVSSAGVLDFFGSHISIRSGRVAVPGGGAAESAWKELVGAAPDQPNEFVPRLLSTDQGWLAAYFDALSRVNRTRQAYFADPRRLKIFYQGLRGENVLPGPAQGVFRLDSNLVLLTNNLQFDPATGQPRIPGNLETWKAIFSASHPGDSKIAQGWRARAARWTTTDQLLAGLFGLSRIAAADGPVQLFLMVSEIDRGRTAEQRLTGQTVRMLGDKYYLYGNQYMLFSEFKGLDNASIARFVNLADGIHRMKDRTLRAETLGTLQANVGLWQILARQGQILRASLNDSWQRLLAPFAKVSSAAQLFTAGRDSLGEILRTAAGRPRVSESEIIALLAGPAQSTAEGQRVRQEIIARMTSVMADQRLVSLDTLFTLSDGLRDKTQSTTQNEFLTQEASELRAFEMPRPLFTTRERAAWASRFFYNRHAEGEMRTDLSRAIATRDPKDVTQAEAQLAPFLRDTLVGLNYAYYEPPGAQLLHNNPLFVRFHDFSGEITGSPDQSWQTPVLLGRGDTPSGGAHLAGSLANLPYVLASVEQGMFVPENIQSLIWVDLVPDLVAGAILPRWWNVSPTELHAATLYQRAGEELITAAAKDEKLRSQILEILSDRMLPETLDQIDDDLRAGRAEAALEETTPSEHSYLMAEFHQKFPGETTYQGEAGKDLAELLRSAPEEASWQKISMDFGVPRPALAQTYTRELLQGKPFPSFMGYASRLLAESWDSNNLYWARLMDESGYQPVQMNLFVPELTHRMINKISATHPEDWAAVRRAMRETGEEFRQNKVPLLAGSTVASGR